MDTNLAPLKYPDYPGSKEDVKILAELMQTMSERLEDICNRIDKCTQSDNVKALMKAANYAACMEMVVQNLTKEQRFALLYQMIGRNF